MLSGAEFRGKVIDIPEVRQKHNSGYKTLLCYCRGTTINNVYNNQVEVTGESINNIHST